MPPALGRLDVSHENRILLTPRGLSYTPAAKPLLLAFTKLVRIAIKRYEDLAGQALVGAAEFQGLLEISEKSARALEEVARLDQWLLRVAGSADGHLLFSVDERTVFAVADVETLEQYLQLQLQSWYPDVEQPAAGVPEVTAGADPLERYRACVMVVHGRDHDARDDLFSLVRALGLKPIEWNEAVRATSSGAPYTGEAVEAAFRLAQAAVVLCTPDEEVLLRSDLRDPDEPAEAQRAWQPRPNVYIEGGIALTTHPTRTIVLELERSGPPATCWDATSSRSPETSSGATASPNACAAPSAPSTPAGQTG